MKPIYATLDSYNQYMEETRDTVLLCPELSQYGLDEGEDFSDEEMPSTNYFDADLEGTFLDPVVKTNASGTVSGTLDEKGLVLLLKVRKLSGAMRAALHRIEDDAIGPEVLLLYDSIRSDIFSGTLVARRVPYSEFTEKMTAKIFLRLLEEEKWGLVVSTQKYPDGEMSGFLEETLFS